MTRDRSSPREPQGSPPNGAVRSSHGWTLAITNLSKIVGLGIGISQARHGRDANEMLILFAAICVLGVQVVENVLLRMVDRLFGANGSGRS